MQKKPHTNKTFFLTGGGTGGHIYPCVSILNELKNKGCESIYYIGNSKNQEYDVISGLNIPFLDVPVFGMPRKFSLKMFRWIFLLIISIIKCIGYALKYKPDAVFATGGYVSAPMVIVSNILNIPYVMHDSDAHPGIVTMAFSKNAKALNLAFNEGKKYVKSKNITNYQNPVRNEFFIISKEDARASLGIKNEFCILIMGGSQGAKSINNAAISVIKHFKDDKNVKLIFQTGRKNYQDTKKQLLTLLYDEAENNDLMPENLIMEPYFEKLYIPILAADIIVSRAGSLSISEILAAKKPSILVPYPYAAHDHQRRNAREIEKLGAAIYVEDANLKENDEKVKSEKSQTNELVTILKNLMQDREKFEKLRKNASIQILKNPTYDILNLILDAAGVSLADTTSQTADTACIQAVPESWNIY